MKKIVKDFEYRNCVAYDVYLKPGLYLFEAWGASGGGQKAKTGKGGYTAGLLKLKNDIDIKIYIGGKGEDPSKEIRLHNGGCNGGGKGGAPYKNIYNSGGGGGGATDFRLNESSESRILVAGGGGGVDGYGGGNNGGLGAPGGGIYSGNMTNFAETALGGTQTYGNENGIGQNGRSGKEHDGGAEGNGGCGGGYRGGTTHTKNADYSNIGGSGGSSYISGHPYCKTNPSFIFTYPTIQIGSESFLDPKNNLETGHYGDGFARITRFVSFSHCYCKHINRQLYFVNILCAYINF